MIDKYIEQLEEENEDMIGGLLKELEIEPPPDLHGKIMEKLGEKKYGGFWKKSKMYVPVAAGILIVFVGLNLFAGDLNSSKKTKGMMEDFAKPQEQMAAEKSVDSQKNLNANKAPTIPGTAVKASGTGPEIENKVLKPVILRTNNSKIVNFVMQKGRMVSENIYEIDLKDYEELSKFDGFSSAVSVELSVDSALSSNEQFVLVEISRE